MGVFPSGGSNGRGGIKEYGYLLLSPPEHSCTVHCIQAHYGPVSGGEAEAGVNGGQAVVGSGRLGLGGDADGGLGGVT